MTRRWKTFVGGSLLLIVALLLYSKSFNNPFICDDLPKIVENVDLRKWSQLPSSLLPNDYRKVDNAAHNDPSRPLVYLIYMTIFHFFELNPVPYHFVNLVGHFLCGLLVLLFMQKILIRLRIENALEFSFLAASIFLIAPINAGTVIYVSGFSDVLSTFFILLSLYLFVGTSVPSRMRLTLSSLSYVLALGSKQSSVVLPFAVFLSDIAFLTRLNWSRIRSRFFYYVPFVLITLGYLLTRWILFSDLGDIEAYHTFPRFSYLWIQGVMVLKYVYLFFIPSHLSLIHAIPLEAYSWPIKGLAWISILSVIVVSIKGVKSDDKSIRMAAFGMLFFLLCLSPTSSFFPTAELFVERRVYLASVGLLFLVLAFSSRIQSSLAKKAFVSTSLVVLVIYSVLILRRETVFSSPKLVWRESLERYPGSVQALMGLAVALTEEGKIKQASEIYDQILRVDPNRVEILRNSAILSLLGRVPKSDLEIATQRIERAIALAPRLTSLNLRAAQIALKSGDVEKAEYHCRIEISLNAEEATCFLMLGEILVRRGKRDEAIGYLRQSVQIDPSLQNAAQKIYDWNQ